MHYLVRKSKKFQDGGKKSKIPSSGWVRVWLQSSSRNHAKICISNQKISFLCFVCFRSFRTARKTWRPISVFTWIDKFYGVIKLFDWRATDVSDLWPFISKWLTVPLEISSTTQVRASTISVSSFVDPWRSSKTMRSRDCLGLETFLGTHFGGKALWDNQLPMCGLWLTATSTW